MASMPIRLKSSAISSPTRNMASAFRRRASMPQPCSAPAAMPPTRPIARRSALPARPRSAIRNRRIEHSDALAAAHQHGAVWSGGELKFIPYGDIEIDAGTMVANVAGTPNSNAADAGQRQHAAALDHCLSVRLISSPIKVSIYAHSGTALTYSGSDGTVGTGTYG